MQKTQQKNKVWVIPEEQAEEFLNAPINYRQLIKDCFKQPVVTKKKTWFGKTKEKEVVLAEFTL